MAAAVRLYAGTQEGLFVWRSRNATWDKVSATLEDRTIDAIDGCRKQPEKVFVGVTRDGLYRTENAGKNWQRLFVGNVRAVTVDPSDEKVIYVGTEPIHLYRSEDGGKSWEEITTLLDLPEEVRKNWTYPQPPHREHVRHIFVHRDDPERIYVCLEPSRPPC